MASAEPESPADPTSAAIRSLSASGVVPSPCSAKSPARMSAAASNASSESAKKCEPGETLRVPVSSRTGRMTGRSKVVVLTSFVLKSRCVSNTRPSSSLYTSVAAKVAGFFHGRRLSNAAEY